LIDFKVVLDPNLEGILNLKREIQNSHCMSQYSKIGEAGGAGGVTFSNPNIPNLVSQAGGAGWMTFSN
jgi:hypothetical protein